MPRPSHSSRFYKPNIIGWGVQNIKLLIMQFSTFPCHLVPLGKIGVVEQNFEDWRRMELTQHPDGWLNLLLKVLYFTSCLALRTQQKHADIPINLI
jgi:hypothetical protein